MPCPCRAGDVFHLLLGMALALDNRWAAVAQPPAASACQPCSAPPAVPALSAAAVHSAMQSVTSVRASTLFPFACRVWPAEDADDVQSLLSLVYHVTGGCS